MAQSWGTGLNSEMGQVYFHGPKIQCTWRFSFSLNIFPGTHHLSFRMSPSDFRFPNLRLGSGKPGKFPCVLSRPWGLFSNISVLWIWSIGKVEKLPGLGGPKRLLGSSQKNSNQSGLRVRCTWISLESFRREHRFLRFLSSR